MKKTLFMAFFIILFSFILPTETQEASGAVLLDRIVATVNEEVITWSELMNVIVIDGKEFLSGATGQEREKKIKEMERPFLNNLIEMKLQLQMAQRMDLEVTDEEIDGAITEIRNKYGLTEETLMNSLKAQGLSAEDYRARLADQILLQKVINYAVRSTIVISDSEIQEYYEEHSEQYDVEEKFRISQIFFVMPVDSHQKEALEEEAQDLVTRIKSGEDFAELAREYSEDPSSEFGGDLGYISKGVALKEVEAAAAALQKGEVSNPFWSPAGLHIIKLEDRTEGGDIEKFREKIKEVLLQKSFEKKYREWKTGLRENAYIDIKL